MFRLIATTLAILFSTSLAFAQTPPEPIQGEKLDPGYHEADPETGDNYDITATSGGNQIEVTFADDSTRWY